MSAYTLVSLLKDCKKKFQGQDGLGSDQPDLAI